MVEVVETHHLLIQRVQLDAALVARVVQRGRRLQERSRLGEGQRAEMPGQGHVEQRTGPRIETGRKSCHGGMVQLPAARSRDRAGGSQVPPGEGIHGQACCPTDQCSMWPGGWCLLRTEPDMHSCPS